jgi:hypothetical protein
MSFASEIYERRDRVRNCGLGGGACCAACEAGHACEAPRGVGDILDIIKDGVATGCVSDPGVPPTGAGHPYRGEDKIAVAPRGSIPLPTPPEGGNWYVAMLPYDQAMPIIQLCAGQPQSSQPFVGYTVPAGAIWQQASDGTVWWGLLTQVNGAATVFFYTFQRPKYIMNDGRRDGFGDIDRIRFGMASSEGLARSQDGMSNDCGCGSEPHDVAWHAWWPEHGRPVVMESPMPTHGVHADAPTGIQPWAPMRPLGVGAAPVGLGTLAQLQTALSGLQGGATGDAAAAFVAATSAAATYLTEGNAGTATDFDSAVDAYKAAGAAAVSATGVSGELSGADSTGTITTYNNQAAAVNNNLNSSTVNSTKSTGTAATAADATQAQTYVSQMQTFYVQGAQAAIAAAQAAPVPTPATPATPPAPAPAPIVVAAPSTASSTNYAAPILIGAGVIGAGIVGYAMYKRYYAKPSASRAGTRKPSGRTVRSARTVRA